MGEIKLGVSLFSFSTDYAKGILTLEDCIREAAEMGAEGFELVGTIMNRSYPHASDKVLGELKSMTDAYGIDFVSYGANTDRGLRKDRDLTEEEMLQSAILDLKTASKFGCKLMRAQYLLSPDALAKLAPYAEEYGVKVGVEIHNPEYPTSPKMLEYLEAIEKSGSEYIGFVPDFGSFATRPNKIYWDEALANGAPLELLEMAAQLRYDDVPRPEAMKRLMEAGANGPVMGAANGMYGFVQFSKTPDLEGLKKIMPHVLYFHGKFHHVNENLQEASIPYHEILPVIKDSRFNGYIMSEYEASDDALGMVDRHLRMERKLLGL